MKAKCASKPPADTRCDLLVFVYENDQDSISYIRETAQEFA